MPDSDHVCSPDSRLCTDYTSCCNATDRMYSCTRDAGHHGPHVACGSYGDHNIHTWEQVREVRLKTSSGGFILAEYLEDGSVKHTEGYSPDECDKWILGAAQWMSGRPTIEAIAERAFAETKTRGSAGGPK